MKLSSFQVFDFRSIEDSTKIECSDMTTLVGVNESGKTNVLKALWKFNPVREGKIDVLHDLPVKKLGNLRNQTEKTKFITVSFDVENEDVSKLESLTGKSYENIEHVTISRYYDGHYSIDEPLLEDSIDIDDDEETEDELDFLSAFVKIMPKFVYYSNYGNLSSKVYLKHALKWINGEKVDGVPVNDEQVRTLKVLFDFVKLDPQEIMDLGADPEVLALKRSRGSEPTPDEIQKAQEDKEQRSILLQSAGVSLTDEFKNWWKQGEYRFRFEADGDYFHILVSDNIRTEEVSLELRSTGLQWFLSFFLVFLMESQNENKGAILLLDEAGLTLHPMAQNDLSLFFESLSENNQIINTTHSPFIIDSNNIDRCRVVFADSKGHTVVSSDLRESSDKLNEKSIYAVHAALGLGVSDVLLNGCQVVIVEGASDQYYLNAIKTFLIKEKLFTPNKEIVFMPSGGVKGISGIASMVSGKNDDLPYIVIDSDKSGKDKKEKLEHSLYNGNERKIIEIKQFSDKNNAEIEDIIPFSLQAKYVDRLFISLEDISFEETYDSQALFCDQVECFAKANGICLHKGWKVDVARDVKKRMDKIKKSDIEEGVIKNWCKLFEMFNK